MDEKNKTFEEILKENRFLVSIETVKIKDFIFSIFSELPPDSYNLKDNLLL